MLKPGSLSDYQGSMAEAMEQEFNRTWRQKYGSDLPEQGREDRRVLFVSIARGVVLYLKEHQDDGFDVLFRDSMGTQQPGELDILVDE